VLFVDGAALWLRDVPSGQVNHHTLVGMGFGVRVALLDGVQVMLDQGWALGDGPVTRRGDTRGHVSLKFLF
jgi:hemolysin activation/secretion protein